MNNKYHVSDNRAFHIVSDTLNKNYLPRTVIDSSNETTFIDVQIQKLNDSELRQLDFDGRLQ